MTDPRNPLVDASADLSSAEIDAISPYDLKKGYDPERRNTSKVIKILAGVVIFVSFLPWAWRFSPFADRTADGLLDQTEFATIAEPICEAAMTELEALPNAIDLETTAERGIQVGQANAILETMVDDLEREIVGSERDVENLEEWIADWRVYLENRADYAGRIAVDENAVFYVTANGQERLDRRIPRFAEANSMRSCVTPDDIA